MSQRANAFFQLRDRVPRKQDDKGVHILALAAQAGQHSLRVIGLHKNAKSEHER